MMRIFGFVLGLALPLLMAATPSRAEDGGTCEKVLCGTFINENGDPEQIPCGCNQICIKKKCLPSPPYCEFDSDCGLGRTCREGGICSCSNDDQCGGKDAGQKCDLAAHTCVAECSANKPCPSGYDCDFDKTRTCILPSCVKDEDCAWSYCDVEASRCGLPGACRTNYHCRSFADAGLDWVCVDDGGGCSPAPAAEGVSCACSLGAADSGWLVPASLFSFFGAVVARSARRRRFRENSR